MEDSNYQDKLSLKYEDHRKVGLENYKHIQELHDEMRSNFDKMSELVLNTKICNFLIQFYNEFKFTIEKLLSINKTYSEQIFSQFQKIANEQSLQKEIERSIKFIELASEDYLLFDKNTYKDQTLTPYIPVSDYVTFKQLSPKPSFHFPEFKRHLDYIYSHQSGMTALLHAPWWYVDIVLVNGYYYNKIKKEADSFNFNECFSLIQEWEKYCKDTNLKREFTFLKLFILRKLFEEQLSYDLLAGRFKIIN